MYLIPLSSSLRNVIYNKKYSVRGLVSGNNNIFAMEVRQVFSNIWWFVFIFLFLAFSATFSNISAISWQPVLVVEEAEVPGENHRPWASNLLVNFITCDCESSVPVFCNLQSRARTYAVLVIGLYELLGNPTT